MNQKITACAVLHHNGRVFIAKRADTKKFLPGKFELPGGHIENGEEIVAGLKRELREELGIEVNVGDPVHVFTYMNGDDHVVEIDFLAELSKPDAEIHLHPEDHSEFRWATPADVDAVWDKRDAEYQAILKGFALIKN